MQLFGRTPDYVVIELDGSFVVGGGVVLTITRDGSIAIGGEGSIGMGGGLSARGGWLMQTQVPEPGQTDGFIEGWAVTGSVSGGHASGGVTQSVGMDWDNVSDPMYGAETAKSIEFGLGGASLGGSLSLAHSWFVVQNVEELSWA